jgi:CRISPR-associated protein Csc3
MQELKALAEYAANNYIRGTSNKRNSLLKPLDIILQELDRCPNPDESNELELVRAGTQGMIFEYLERITGAGYKLGSTKQGKVNHYVDLFFDEVLKKAHHGKANRLLTRERLIRSAYLVYYRQALAEYFVARGKAKDIAEAEGKIENTDEEDMDQGDDK